MARRLEPRDANELSLDDKLDVARTLTRLQHRIQTRHELNELEAEIKQAHAQEIDNGRVIQPVVPGTDEIRQLYGFGAAALGAGAPEAGSAHATH